MIPFQKQDNETTRTKSVSQNQDYFAADPFHLWAQSWKDRRRTVCPSPPQSSRLDGNVISSASAHSCCAHPFDSIITDKIKIHHVSHIFNSLLHFPSYRRQFPFTHITSDCVRQLKAEQ
jgi:hypothetical protein